MSNEPIFGRRAALRGFAAFTGVALLAACGSSAKSASSATTATTAADGTTGATTAAASAAQSATTTAASTTATTAVAATATDLVTIPEETAGPFPGDGSNGPDALTIDGVIRKDIRSSFGSASAVAEGVPLTIQFTLLDHANGDTPLQDAAVYVWHCNRDGEYSMYGQGITTENYLRGVQSSDANGLVTFTSIFPAAYSGRWPHIHFEVYKSAADATSGGTKLATSQIALPQATCAEVYQTDGYSQSATNLAQTSLTTDMVFSDDGGVHELATMSGTVASGLTAALTVGVGT